MKNVRIGVLLFAVLGVSSVVSAGLFSENFDSYVAGSQMAGQGGWKGWDNNPAAGAPVSNAFSVSGANSVEIIGSSDLVHPFDIAGGIVEFTAMQFIPANASGSTYFILLNQYNDGGPCDWSVQLNCDINAGQIISDNGGGVTTPMVKDQWVQLRFLIDLANNTVSEYYNGTLLSSHEWDDNVHGTLGAIDLFGNSASSVFYDDINIVPEPATLSLLGLGVLALIRKRG